MKVVVLRDDMTVNEAVRAYPSTVAVFDRFGIDACCGGARRIVEAAERHGVDVAALLQALDDAIREPTT